VAERLRQALGSYSDTPLGGAAVRQAKSGSHAKRKASLTGAELQAAIDDSIPSEPDLRSTFYRVSDAAELSSATGISLFSGPRRT
jgi:hypothetical protein